MNLYWKLAATAITIATLFYAGWHAHTIVDKANEHKALEDALKRAIAAESQIVDFNTQLANIPHDKDTCYNTAIPADVVRLLK